MKRAGIFLFYDDKGIVYDYVLYLLESLKKNVSDLYIICNGYLREDSREKLKKYTNYVYERPNEGFDAAAFQDVLLNRCGFEKLRTYDELVLCNDSFFGPFYPFENVFEEMSEKDIDFWGLSSHGEAPSKKQMCPYGYRPRYIQTYFIVVRKRMLHSQAFEDFWTTLPVFEDFDSLVEKYGCVFTKHFEDLGYTWAVYSDTSDLESTDRAKNCSHHMFNTYEMVANRKLPIIKRKTFTIPKETRLRYSSADDLPNALEYVRKNSDYDLNLIWTYLLEKYNIYDLRNNLNLYYVLPSEAKIGETNQKKKVALIAHLFYEDLFDYHCGLLNHLPEYIDVYITTNSEEKKKAIETKYFNQKKSRRVQVFVVNAKGRELSALLVHCAGIPTQYEYLCFVHDKKSGQKEFSTVGASFGKMIIDSMLGSTEYVENIICTFDQNPRLGMLVPPNVYWGTYFQSSVDYWTICYDKTVEIMSRLGLKGNLDRNKAPVSVGTTFWCKVDALKPIFEENWTYDDFPGEPMAVDGTFSHGLERVFPYIAQTQGYYTGVVMSCKMASAEIANFRYMTSETLKALAGTPYVNQDTFSHFMQSVSQLKYRIGTPTANAVLRLERKIYHKLKNCAKKIIPAPMWEKLKVVLKRVLRRDN